MEKIIFTQLHQNSKLMQIFLFTESVIVENIKKNKISKCVFLTEKALVTFRQDQTDKETKKILEVSF